MEEDDTATDMDEEYEDNEDEEVIAVAEEVEPEGWVKHMKAASIAWEAFLPIYNEAWQAQLISC